MSSVPNSSDAGSGMRGANPNPPVTPIVLKEPITIVMKQPGRWYWWLLRGFGLVLLGIAIGQSSSTMNDFNDGESKVREEFVSGSRRATDKIAVIKIDGIISSGEGYIKHQIDQVADDKNVKAVVLRVESPGGTVSGSDYIYHHLKDMLAERKIPMVVSMGSIAASGGYYVSMAGGDAEKNIFAEPTTWTGSIGVIIPHYDLSGLLEKYNVSDDSIASHRFKQMGSPTRKLGETERAEERDLLQSLVNESFTGFKQIVLDSRKPLRDNPELQKTAFTGRIFTAKQAKEQGLVDELGFMEDAVERAAERAGIDAENVRVVKYGKRESLAKALFGSESESRNSLTELSALIDLATPRAYYLCSFLPPGITELPKNWLPQIK
jgi:protease-4